MLYIKTFDVQDNLTGAEKLVDPIFIRWQAENGMKVCCNQEDAQAVVSADCDRFYLINGCMPRSEKEPYAEFISEAEYKVIIDYDPEDDDPDVPEGEDEEEILTRAELTALVKELKRENEFLGDCLLEMSEVVYAEDDD